MDTAHHGINSPVEFDDAMSCSAPDTAQPVVLEDGSLAMKHYKSGKILTACGKMEYVFMTQANICMSWVNAQDVECILNKRGGCCGQSRPGIFSFANASDVRRWTNRGGR